MTPILRFAAVALVVALASAAPALAQPRDGLHGGFGGRGYGPGLHRNGPGGFGGGARLGARFQQRFDRANSSHDGRLTLSQARGGNMPVIARHFDEIDTDHKGYITMDQVQSYRQQMTARRHEAQGGDSGAAAGADDQDAAPP